MQIRDDIYTRQLGREKRAREEAERLLEQKSRELYKQANERNRALTALAESEERYRLIVELSPDAILIESEGKIVFVNHTARLLFKESQSRTLKGLSVLDITAPQNRAQATEVIKTLIQGADPRQTEEFALRLDGSLVEVSVRRAFVIFAGQPAIQMVVRDISVRKTLEKQLAYQATHDTLTGVSNRAALFAHLSKSLAEAKNLGQPVWVAFLDLDRFKQINDRFGHRVGDQLLIIVTERLTHVLRRTDMLGRFGGDEFVIVLQGCPTGNTTSDLFERVMASIREPITIDSNTLHVGCSIGVATYPGDGETPDELLANADAAMYRAKQSGRNRCQFYNSDIQEQLVKRTRIEMGLVDILDRGELFIEYQPQVSIETGMVSGAEALLRWEHPELGSLTPNEFIPIAEESSTINSIGAWVVRNACNQIAQWEREGLGKLRVAVNLSARQLPELSLSSIVQSALISSGLAPDRLDLELTETLMMSDIKLTQETLLELKQQGVQISVDDFGTGYSSLVYLQTLPLSSLKIDKQFIQALQNDTKHTSNKIVITLIKLAHSLKLRVVAEGVETQSQLHFLRQHGCDEIQGYLCSPPLRAADFSAFMKNHQPQAWC
ncbi:MAG: EAL domain-containing protein [Oxalobacteraceae bacterium]|jgi:diguanylate cyclase (GGDEF)-like protein/PAS domain S-box-containing protein|nr:EAL domain-containing protein [Oxalobacteraceae bacterium]